MRRQRESGAIEISPGRGKNRNSAKSWAIAHARLKEIISRCRPNELIRAARGTRGGGLVKQISIFVLGFVTAFASAPAPAQDLTAGKTPAQLFRSDCAECHRSPNGLARNHDVRGLADFLREHYTTKSETAGALAAYVSGFAAGGAAARNRGTGVVAPAAGERRQVERRNRGEGDATANGDDARTTVRPVDDSVGRHRRLTGVSGDGSPKTPKRRSGADVDEQPPPGGNVSPAPAASPAATSPGLEP
jgi:hypothetical protein